MKREADHDELDDVLAAIGRTVNQLVDNIRDHAELAPAATSMLMVTVTYGNPNRVYLTVLDTGIGLAVSAGKRVGGLSPDSSALVRQALHGLLPAYDRDRARGLDAVRSVAEVYGGQLFLATNGGPDLPEHSALIVGPQRGSPDVEWQPSQVDHIPIRGTIVSMSVPLPAPPQALSLDRNAVADQRLTW